MKIGIIFYASIFGDRYLQMAQNMEIGIVLSPILTYNKKDTCERKHWILIMYIHLPPEDPTFRRFRIFQSHDRPQFEDEIEGNQQI